MLTFPIKTFTSQYRPEIKSKSDILIPKQYK